MSGPSSLSGTSVTVRDGTIVFSAVTDATGSYGISGIPFGLYNITASRSGFQTLTQEVNLITANPTWTKTLTAAVVDADGDGYNSTVDCDDSRNAMYPGISESSGQSGCGTYATRTCHSLVTSWEWTYSNPTSACSSGSGSSSGSRAGSSVVGPVVAPKVTGGQNYAYIVDFRKNTNITRVFRMDEAIYLYIGSDQVQILLADVQKKFIQYNVTGKYVDKLDFLDLNKSISMNIDKKKGDDITLTLEKVNLKGDVKSAELTIELYNPNKGQETKSVVETVAQVTKQAMNAVIDVAENTVESIKDRPTLSMGVGITAAIALLGSLAYLIFVRPK
jgi:hypothetical protein